MNPKFNDFEELSGEKVEFKGREMYIVASSQEIVVLATSDLKDDTRIIFADLLVSWEYALEDQLSKLGYNDENALYEYFVTDL